MCNAGLHVHGMKIIFIVSNVTCKYRCVMVTCTRHENSYVLVLVRVHIDVGATLLDRRKQASLWMEGDSVRAQQMSKLQYKSDKMIKADKIAKAEKLEKQAWVEKIERQEKVRSSRVMDPLEAHMLSKITAGVDTMIMTGKHKEYMLAEEVRNVLSLGVD